MHGVVAGTPEQSKVGDPVPAMTAQSAAEACATHRLIVFRSAVCGKRYRRVMPVSCLLSSFAVGVVQVRPSQGRRGRNTGSYVDRGERREVRAWATRTVKRLRGHDTKLAGTMSECGILTSASS